MDKQLSQYIRHHIVFVTSIVIIVFALLAVGEYYLYRQIMHVNRMVSEGFMQVKTAQDSQSQDILQDNNVVDMEKK